MIRRKAEVIMAVRGGLLSLEESCSRYAVSPDEILSWQHCIDRFGMAGLRMELCGILGDEAIRRRGLPALG